MDAASTVAVRHDVYGRSSGVPWVLLHGFPLNRSMWAPQVPALTRHGLRLVVPDLRGHGDSPVPDGPSTMDLVAADVLRLADRLRIDRFVVAGLSMGGYVALAAAATRPERLAGLVLADTRAEPDSPEARARRIALAERVKEEGLEPLAEAMVPEFFTPQTARTRPGVVDAATRMIRGTPRAGAVNAMLGMAQRPDRRPLLPAIRVPTLVVVGREDRLTPPDASRAMANGIPGARLVELEGAAHLSNLEQPDAFNAAILEWARSARLLAA